MNVDIRLPIGGMFSLIGLILAIYGLRTMGDEELYRRSLGINMNLWWGLVMLAFGGIMLLLSMKNRSKPADASRTPDSTPRPRH